MMLGASRCSTSLSLIIGLVALICALVAFLPLLGWANWLIIPLAIIGAGDRHDLARQRRP